jgi:hypothetical protein|nr:MAG TPA: hypothetical protein [Caudoviricetes sp.]
MLTLGEAQEIFIDQTPGMGVVHVAGTMATDAEPTYVEYWQCVDPNIVVHWYDGPGYPVMIEIEGLTGTLQRDIVGPEDIESVVAWLDQN